MPTDDAPLDVAAGDRLQSDFDQVEAALRHLDDHEHDAAAAIVAELERSSNTDPSLTLDLTEGSDASADVRVAPEGLAPHPS